jgi:hypothetical protein
MTASTLRFVIVATSYDECSGGAIALHRLCALIRDCGVAATIWPIGRPVRRAGMLFGCDPKILRWTLSQWVAGGFSTCSEFRTPLATDSDLEDAVVVYPEIVAGNPLGVEQVVRWLLHRPGFHTKRIEFGPHDLCFHFQEAFRDPTLGLPEGGLLQTVYVRHDIFRNPGTASRSGVCYMRRKAQSRDMSQLPSDAECLDGKSLREIAQAFARCERFVSYDPYTMYSRYAAISGCLSIVVPQPGVSKEQWRPEERLRYGVAYGFDDVNWALDTQDRALSALKDQEREANETVQRFIARCEEYFASRRQTRCLSFPTSTTLLK